MNGRPFLLAHGWGFDARFWTPLREHLAGSMIVTWEAGYLGAKAARPLPAPGYIAIGHSAGVLDLLAHLPPGCAGLVAINGFTRFMATDDFVHGSARRTLARMQAQAATDPEGVLRAFRARCGTGSPPETAGSIDAEALAAGLMRLAEQDSRARLTTLGLPVRALAAHDDPIVSPAHSRACFAEDAIRWSGTGGHLLPLTRPDWCASQLAGLPA